MAVFARVLLQEERVGFDNQLGAVERTLQAKIKDYEELLLLSGDANHAREVKGMLHLKNNVVMGIPGHRRRPDTVPH